MINIHKINIVTVSLLGILIYLLNQFCYVYQCALVFTSIVFIVSTQALKINPIEGYKYIILGIATSLPIYLIKGSLNNGLVIISLLSLLIASCSSIYTTTKLKTTYSMPVILLISILISAVIDGIIISAYLNLYSNFSLFKIINIFNLELFFKSIYGLVFSALIVCFIGIIGSQRKNKLS